MCTSDKLNLTNRDRAKLVTYFLLQVLLIQLEKTPYQAADIHQLTSTNYLPVEYAERLPKYRAKLRILNNLQDIPEEDLILIIKMNSETVPHKIKKALTTLPIYKDRLKIILLFYHQIEAETVEAFLQELSSFQLLNVIGVFKSDETVKAITYNPFFKTVNVCEDMQCLSAKYFNLNRYPIVISMEQRFGGW